jgi:hypothetical protein
MAGIINAARIAMIETTTNSSIKVKPFLVASRDELTLTFDVLNALSFTKITQREPFGTPFRQALDTLITFVSRKPATPGV